VQPKWLYFKEHHKKHFSYETWAPNESEIQTNLGLAKPAKPIRKSSLGLVAKTNFQKWWLRGSGGMR